MEMNLVSFLLLFSFLYIIFRKWRRSQKQNLPPGPWRLPLIGSLHHLISGHNPHRIFRDLARKYGPVMYLELGEVPTVIISSPSTSKQVLKTHDLAFASRPQFTSTDIVMYNNKDIAFAEYSDYWKQMRKIYIMELPSAKMVKSFSSIRKDERSSVLSSIDYVGGSCEVNMMEKIVRFTSSVTCRLVFGKLCRDPAGIKGNGAYGGEDLVDVFLRIKESDQLQFPITNNHIKAVILDMFTAGTETSSTTIIWALSELMKHPNVLAKAQSEVRQAFQEKIDFDEEDLDNLPYLKLHAPSKVHRECREETIVDGYTIPAKATVLVNTWAMGRDLEVWDDPESFIPERFENSPIDYLGNNYEFLPFGAGKRICPGMQFGLANVKQPLARLLYHFNWGLPCGTNTPKDLDMSEKSGLSAAKEKDLYLIAKTNQSLDIML
ncbi:hypothetical protein H5410_032862 [Solanum commersonii]|uniref:Cytochrome P450 n=1 Tax=Solanum commersonii TaxID=4109 RepID=A0A9J5YQV2_SOLCO|nr:hypothetical protein H5410_032862 [Solanum commersonii]